MSDFQTALTHYRIKFPTLAALGAAPQFAEWQGEYDRVAAGGLAATLFTSQSSETGSATVARNFDQKALLDALTTRRAELDEAFAALVGAPVTVKPRPLGIRVKLGC